MGGCCSPSPRPHRPATDLGYLLHKHPERVQSFDVPRRRRRTSSTRRPTDERCTAALLLEVDPVGLVRAASGRATRFALASTSTTGRTPPRSCSRSRSARCSARRCAAAATDRPELAGAGDPARGRGCRCCRAGGGADLVAPAVRAARLGGRRPPPIPLDPDDPQWGDSRLRRPAPHRRRCGSPTRSTTSTCCSRSSTTPSTTGSAPTRSTSCCAPAAAGWPTTRSATLIARRYLAHRRALVADAAASRLAEADDGRRPARRRDRSRSRPRPAGASRCAERCRRRAVVAALRERGRPPGASTSAAARARCCADLLGGPRASPRSSASTCPPARCERAARRLRLDRLPDRQRDRIELLQGVAHLPRRRGCAGFDAAVLMEVIEHVDPPRLPALERAVFGHARPGAGGRDHAERRVQRALRGAGRRRAAAPRPPLRVDPGRVRAPGPTEVARPVRLRGRAPRRRRRRRRRSAPRPSWRCSRRRRWPR